jgi:hypothetical protein
VTDARPALAALALADPPDRWRALGFAVGDDGRCTLGDVDIRFGAAGRGITDWKVTDAPGLDAALGLTGPAPAPEAVPAPDVVPEPEAVPAPDTAPARGAPRAGAPGEHPNGAIGLDHVVVVVPDFDATATRLEQIDLPFRRVRQASETVRQGFRRLGPAILEVVEAPGAGGPAFWGLVVVVTDLDALAAAATPHVTPARPAVQPGRRIAPVSRSAGLTTQLAFMNPAPSGPRPSPE